VSQNDVETFQSEEDISKIYLFSEKELTPPIFSALSSGFRNRIRFAFVHKSEETQEAQQALVPQFHI
jgi:tRNA/tmRNA/rRNA uracil-C5-methylase (TrmA/RlmC/RlmD family)